MFDLVLLLLSKQVPKQRFFLQNRTEPKPQFYASVLTVRFWNGAALVSWTLTVGCSLQVISPTRLAGGCYRWDQRWDRRRPCTPRV